MKTVVNLNEEERRFIQSLLNDTREQFAEAFLQLASSNTKKDRRKFIAYRVTLTELIVPRPVPVPAPDEELGELSNKTEEEQKGGESC